MALNWSVRRQLLYYAVAAAVAIVLGVLAWQVIFSNEATCFDKRQNGGESGVDCGGPCSLLCQNVAREPVALWSRAFSTGPHTYTAAAYVQNQNAGAGAHAVSYSFKLFDKDNLLIAEKTNVTDLPPVRTIAIVEPNIDVGNRTVARTLFSFSTVPSWGKVPAERVIELEVTDQQLSADGSRLSATLGNNTLEDATNVTVVGVLFDPGGTALAASKSVIGRIARKSSEPVVFTWPDGTIGVSRAEIIVLPSF